MKKLLTILLIFTIKAFGQPPSFFPVEHWRVSGYGMAFNVEVHDINKDGKQDIIVGNWNDTYVYFGGAGVLDNSVDVTYTGRCLAVCDYNGDGFKDLIAMHLTNYDPSRFDYDGEILFYYGSNSTTLAIDTIPEYSIPLPTLYPTRDYFSIGAGKPGVEYGDFNNDGKQDIVINSENSLRKPQDSTAGDLDNYGGTIYIYIGNEIPPDTATYKVHGGKRGLGMPVLDNYGTCFHVGDINNDDFDDLILSIRVRSIPPGSRDSLNVFHIYLGNNNFSFVEGGETFKYESLMKNEWYSYGWVKLLFSLSDINGSGFPDLIIYRPDRDSIHHVHFGSFNAIDTIPSFYITDPDTTNPSISVGATAHNIGDFNNDGFDDFILSPSYYKSFSLHLGGPHISNKNPYGMRGLLEACGSFPHKAINCGDQNGDRVKDFVATESCGSGRGYVLIFLGNPHIVTNIHETQTSHPAEYILVQNYPNPFNPSTIINYELKSKNSITLKIYDLLGKEVLTLINNEEKDAGEYQAEFDASKYKLASGIYFCELKTKDGYSNRIKMLYLK